MNPEFWHQRWQDRYIGFHEGKPNEQLRAYFHHLNLKPGSHIFLPLCGKTKDISWLLDNGYKVTGAELSGIAVTELFEELSVTPEIKEDGTFKVFTHDQLTIFNGNIFELGPEDLNSVHAVYDRAALVALPAAMRKRYTAHLNDLTNKASQLLLCFEYDQTAVDGPPFSISEQEIRSHYGASHTLRLLESRDLPGGLKGSVPAKEKVWMLEPLF